MYSHLANLVSLTTSPLREEEKIEFDQNIVETRIDVLTRWFMGINISAFITPKVQNNSGYLILVVSI